MTIDDRRRGIGAPAERSRTEKSEESDPQECPAGNGQRRVLRFVYCGGRPQQKAHHQGSDARSQLDHDPPCIVERAEFAEPARPHATCHWDVDDQQPDA